MRKILFTMLIFSLGVLLASQETEMRLRLVERSK